MAIKTKEKKMSLSALISIGVLIVSSGVGWGSSVSNAKNLEQSVQELKEELKQLRHETLPLCQDRCRLS